MALASLGLRAEHTANPQQQQRPTHLISLLPVGNLQGPVKGRAADQARGLSAAAKPDQQRQQHQHVAHLHLHLAAQPCDVGNQWRANPQADDWRACEVVRHGRKAI